MPPRTFLFVPANRPRMFAHAEASAADRIVLDLEDAVPMAEKAAGRAALAEGLAAFSTPETRVFLRLNGDPEERDADFAVAGALPLAGFVIPKINAPEDVQHVNHWLDWIPNTELARRVTLVALIESPAGVLSAPAFVTARVPRLSALAFGAEDFREAMGITDTGSGQLLDAARASIAMAAAAAGL
ncbi:MAG TPA: aldolase/citrate lyase family protein, partial [Vicinamibacterales bacterium]